MTSTAAAAPEVTRIRIVAGTAHRRAFLRALVAGRPEFDISEDNLTADAGDPIVVLDLERSTQATYGILPTERAGVIVLSDSHDLNWIGDTSPKEPIALLNRNCDQHQFLAAIRAVREGLSVLAPETLEFFLRRSPECIALEPGEEELTSRETEVLHMMTAGLTNREIATALGISENTVKFHAASIFGKLGTSTRTEAVTEGIRRGLIVL